MSCVDTDAWTCPRCDETTRGNARTRRTQQRAHAKRHSVERGQLTEEARESAAPTPLQIPSAPRQRTRTR